jgi:hypothetical protein
MVFKEPRIRLVKYYPYRTAHVRDDIVRLPREHTRSFEEALAKLAGLPHPDNQTCYVIEDTTGFDVKTVAVMFTDFTCVIGKRVDEGGW